MKSRAHKPLLLSMAAFGLLTTTTACNPANYFNTLADTSRVAAVVTTPGQINWAYRRQRDGGMIYEGSGKVTVTPPVISLTLDANSSPIRYSSARAQFFDPATLQVSPTSGRVTLPATPFSTPTVVPIPLVLMQKDRATAPSPVSVTLDGLITQDLINRTDQSATGSAIPMVTAEVTLVGINDFGAMANTRLYVPINVNSTYTDVD
ncbi:hypothetical protein J7643_07285 [bacterium]|nr:hypothetical protein [bacterium]